MQNIISVLGTTASGKTSFALDLAQNILEKPELLSAPIIEHLPENLLTKKFQGVDIISADSRQVYSDLSIISGADVPEEMTSQENLTFEFPYFESQNGSIRLHGVSVLNKSEDWSVSHFKNFAISVITQSWSSNRLPIIVGGSGLYHRQLYSTDPNLYVPPNEFVRKKAQKLSVTELQEWLQSVDSQRLKQMNNSDIQNPRRLVRAIEIAIGRPHAEGIINLPQKDTFQVTQFGLTLPLQVLEKRITQRVLQRVKSGAIQEAMKLQTYCASDSHPICKTLGLSDIFSHLNGQLSIDECVSDWSLHEYQYAKRQLTWFQKNKGIIWLDSQKKTQYTND